MQIHAQISYVHGLRPLCQRNFSNKGKGRSHQTSITPWEPHPDESFSWNDQLSWQVYPKPELYRLRFFKARLRRKVFPLSLGSLNLYVSLPTQVHSANWPQTPVLFMNDLPTVVSWNVKPELRMTLCSTPILSLQLTMLPFNRTCCVRARVTILARHGRWRNWLCLIVGLCKSDQATLKMQWIPNSPRSTVSPGEKKTDPTPFKR